MIGCALPTCLLSCKQPARLPPRAAKFSTAAHTSDEGCAAQQPDLITGACCKQVASKAVAGAASPAEPFRQLCGPADPELARAVRPHSLRARHGSSMARNAVHCTDLPEDCEQETAYCFTVLAAAR